MPKSIIDTTLNYSPNFDLKKRRLKQIKFIIFHYTGMKKQKDAITKLTSINSKVSSHYFIKNNGEILTLSLFEELSPGVRLIALDSREIVFDREGEDSLVVINFKNQIVERNK